VKQRLELFALSGLLLCSTVACNGDVSLGKNGIDPDDKVPPPGSGGTGGSAGTGGTAGIGGTGSNPTTCNGGGEPWSEVLRGEWTLEAGEEKYFCVRRTMTEHRFIRATRGRHALGTYSAVLSVGPQAGPDGTEPCPQPPDGHQDVFSSRAGTHVASLPDGQALPVFAGQQVVLRVDVINTHARALSGEAIQEVQWVPASAATHAVTRLDPGVFPYGLEERVPPGNECDPWATLFSENWTIPGGEEMYLCARKTLTAHLTMREIQSTSPYGTHSLVVSSGQAIEPDEVSSCDWETVQGQVLLGSIEGTHRIGGNEGQGLTIPAGSQLLLNLHLVNPSLDTLNGPAIVQVR
jgi:hypothetical protein